MKLKIYQIDAFAEKIFQGNPAAVCPLESWLDDSILQAIAEENNLSETAYFVPTKKGFHIRWFTPTIEVNLCGHATLAAAFVLFNMLNYEKETITFDSKSGDLIVTKKGELIEMDFPAETLKTCPTPEELVEALGKRPTEVLAGSDYVAIFDSEEDIGEIKPDFSKLANLGLRGVAITAKGNDVDFISRFFAPKYGIDEDPVTGSAHCALAPFWSEKLNRKKLFAAQLSKRGGQVQCEVTGERVFLSGCAVKYLEGEIVV